VGTGATSDGQDMAADAPAKLGIGVTGHRWREQGDEAHARVERELEGLLRAIADAMRAGGLDHGRLISSLAIGADTLAAQKALALGFELDVVLPVWREAYARDFAGTEGARAVFDRCLGRARAVFELPGEAVADDAAYERAGHVMLGQCDLLIAIWDGKPARGRGGTEQIVREAVGRHIPVIHIDAAGLQPTMILWSSLDPYGLAHTRVENVARGSVDGLAALVQGLIAGFGGAEAESAARQPAARFKLAFAYPMLLAVVGVRRLRRSDFHFPDESAVETQFTATCIDRKASALPFTGAIRSILSPRFAAADAAAVQFAKLYRHGFVANFTLAAIAVLLALVSPDAPEILRPVLTATEIIVIARILWLTRTGRREGWHQRWIGARFLAERLRCLALSAQLADLDLQRTPANGDSVAILGETAHRLGLPHVRVDGVYVDCVRASVLALIEDQIAYQHGSARMMHKLDHRLHNAGTFLFALTAFSCVAVLLYKLSKIATHSPMLAGIEPGVMAAAILVSAGIPAIGAALYGIRMQGDFSGIAGRADALVANLTLLRDAARAQAEETDAVAFDELRHIIRRAADLMSSELAGWRLAHGARPLTLPG
jgi:hypothetical protein